MAIIRHKQRAVNSVIPQQGNKRFLKGASAGDFVPQPLARIIKVAGEECGCEYVGPDNTCLSRCLYEIRYSNYTNPPDSFTWGNTGGSVVLGGGPGDDFIVIETTSGDDVSIDLTCTVTDTVSSDTDDAAGTFIQKHTDTTQPVVFIGPDINDTSFVENVAISAFDFSVVFTGTITGYSLVGSWPPGLSIDNDGLLTGTPTGVAVYGGLQVQASGPGGTAVTNPFTVTITSAQAQSLVVSEVIAGECEYNSGLGESNCKATGEYTATPSGFAFPITSWVWEITSSTGGAPAIDTGQGTDTVEVSSTAGAQISVTLKCTASNVQGENASDLTQFFQKHDDVIEPIVWIGPDLGPYTWTINELVQIAYGGHFSGTITGYQLSGTWPPGFTVSASGQVEGTPTAFASYGPIGVNAVNVVDSAPSNQTTAEVVDNPPIFVGTIPNFEEEDGTPMAPYQASNHYQTGGTPTLYTLALNPAWMSINSSTGEISGTPDAVAVTNNVQVGAANSGGSDPSNQFSVTVTEAPLQPPTYVGPITLDDLTVDELMTPYDFSAHFSTGDAVDSYSISATPSGLSFNTNTGVLSGTPDTIANTTGVTVTATNVAGSTPTDAFAINVVASTGYGDSYVYEISVDAGVAHTIPLIDLSGVFNFEVDYGDGSPPVQVTDFDDATKTHTYTDAGSYIVQITGSMNRLKFDGSSAQGQVRKLLNLGNTGLRDTTDMFRDCSSLNHVDTGTVGATGNAAIGMFRNAVASKLFFDMSNFDYTTITRIDYMFENSHIPQSGIDTLKASTMGNITLFASLFNGANTGTDFNHPDIDTSSATSMLRMFRTSDFTSGTFDAFNISNLGTAQDMFTGVTINTTDYDALLISWAGQAPGIQSDVLFSGGNSKYSAGAATDARAVLTGTYNWSITDGGPA